MPVHNSTASRPGAVAQPPPVVNLRRRESSLIFFCTGILPAVLVLAQLAMPATLCGYIAVSPACVARPPSAVQKKMSF
jgi:hypothetical protein